MQRVPTGARPTQRVGFRVSGFQRSLAAAGLLALALSALGAPQSNTTTSSTTNTTTQIAIPAQSAVVAQVNGVALTMNDVLPPTVGPTITNATLDLEPPRIRTGCR